MKKWLVSVFVVLALFTATSVWAQSVTMTTAQKVLLTATAYNASGAVVPTPQAASTVQWSSTCTSCTFVGGTYDTAAKAWTVWFEPGPTEYGTFAVNMKLTVSGTVFTAPALSVTIGEVVVMPASVKIVAGTPIAK
jgi:hypothetical protein